mmetsp:Transcript_4594/g.13665  ORF Transcript_4594/g.13665 Transcript_4594/m.13665 type:complete len:396 (-) Transcript_4594:129-1316(-)
MRGPDPGDQEQLWRGLPRRVQVHGQGAAGEAHVLHECHVPPSKGGRVNGLVLPLPDRPGGSAPSYALQDDQAGQGPGRVRSLLGLPDELGTSVHQVCERGVVRYWSLARAHVVVGVIFSITNNAKVFYYSTILYYTQLSSLRPGVHGHQEAPGHHRKEGKVVLGDSRTRLPKLLQGSPHPHLVGFLRSRSPLHRPDLVQLGLLFLRLPSCFGPLLSLVLGLPAVLLRLPLIKRAPPPLLPRELLSVPVVKRAPSPAAGAGATRRGPNLPPAEVVEGPLVRITQRLVSLRYPQKVCAAAAAVVLSFLHVGVVLQRQLPVSTLDVALRCILIDSEHLVKAFGSSTIILVLARGSHHDVACKPLPDHSRGRKGPARGRWKDRERDIRADEAYQPPLPR